MKQANTVTWILAGALVVALMAIAFLLGRGSAPATQAVALADPPLVSRPIRDPEPDSPAPPEEAPRTGQVHIERGADGILITNDAPTGARIERRGDEIEITDDGAIAVGVRAYFAQVDAIEAGPAGISADAYAQQLLTEMTAGNASGFETLEADLARAEKQLAAVTPPEPCAEYHRTSLEAARGAKEVMGELKSAMGSGDLGRVQAISARVQGLEASKARLDEMRKDLERRYGL